jgi:tetratricopeptide (TPR) repeat protein
MKRLLFSSIIVLMVWSSYSWAQPSAPDISMYLSQIESGQSEQVKAEIPDLLKKYPNNPGVLYLQALTTSDGAEAVRMYQSIVDNFPRSEWADDALYKVYQFYYAIGLYRTAEMKMSQLKREYPTSKYVSSSAGMETKDLAEEKETPVPDPTTGKVEDAATSEEPKTEAPQGQFALQVGAYSTQVNAEKQKLFFEDQGFAVDVINKVKNGKSLYLVLVGAFATYDLAKAKGLEIKKAYNIDSIVVSR